MLDTRSTFSFLSFKQRIMYSQRLLNSLEVLKVSAGMTTIANNDEGKASLHTNGADQPNREGSSERVREKDATDLILRSIAEIGSRSNNPKCDGKSEYIVG